MTAELGDIDATARPAIPRPSARVEARVGPRLAWSAAAGWALCGFAVLAYCGLLVVGRSSPLGVVVVLLALAISAPAIEAMGRKFPDIEMAGILRMSLGLKLLATLPRFEARQDSIDYHRVGSVLADSFRKFDFTVNTGRDVPGTGSVRYFTGIVEVFTFEDEFATFVVFSLLGFVGLMLFVAAFRIALPNADSMRYALLLLFWPSLIYWPSSTGKEALMLLCLGLVAFGTARLMQGRTTGLPLAALGLLGSGMIRPHVSLIAVTAILVAIIVRAPGGGFLSAVWRVGLIGVLLFGGSVASDSVEAFFNIDGLNPTGLAAALDLVSNRSSQGGSLFTAARVDSIVDYPWGFVTVLLRPFPYEASSVPMMVSSIEGLVLGAMLVGSIPRVFAALRHLRAEAYVAYAVSFSLVFVYLFSALGNFGILARQRAMTLPLVLVIVALPTAKERVRNRRQRVAQ